VIARSKQIKRGNPLDTETMVGAQASKQQFDKILAYVQIGKDEGAEVLMGGKVAALGADYSEGYYIKSTIMKGGNKMRIFQEEFLVLLFQ
jgi:aldehyde dehydrogenase